MNPIYEAIKSHRGNSVRESKQDDSRSKVLSMLGSMNPQQKAKLKAYTPMLHSLAKKFGVSEYSFQKCMNEMNL